jgi:hypothetical protein
LHQKSKIISCFKFVFTSINLTFIISWIIILSEASTMTFAEFNSAGGSPLGEVSDQDNLVALSNAGNVS